MPTYERLPRFDRDYAKLTADERKAFARAAAVFIEDMGRGRGFRKGLRVKRVQGTDNVFEITWADDGRATWQYGAEVEPGQPHIVWRRIGGHAILARP